MHASDWSKAITWPHSTWSRCHLIGTHQSRDHIQLDQGATWLVHINHVTTFNLTKEPSWLVHINHVTTLNLTKEPSGWYTSITWPYLGDFRENPKVVFISNFSRKHAGDNFWSHFRQQFWLPKQLKYTFLHYLVFQMLLFVNREIVAFYTIKKKKKKMFEYKINLFCVSFIVFPRLW